MGMQIILQILVLVSKIAQFKSYAAGLIRVRGCGEIAIIEFEIIRMNCTRKNKNLMWNIHFTVFAPIERLKKQEVQKLIFGLGKFIHLFAMLPKKTKTNTTITYNQACKKSFE